MELSVLYQMFLDCAVVTADSRNCPEGSLFIALKGESSNRSASAAQALEDDCAYAVVDEAEYAPKSNKRIILVGSCLQALQQLANYHRRQLGTKVIGITGTNDKAMAKESISVVLAKAHNVLYTEGNLNNHIGVPMTLLRLETEHDLAAIKMGANHPGGIKFLVYIAEPDYGIITNVGKTHLEGFGSFEGVIRTKGESYDCLRKKDDSTVFIHHSNVYLMDIARGLNPIPYGSESSLYVNGHVTGNSPHLTFEWKVGRDGNLHQVQTQFIGEYNFPNALAAVAIGRFFGVESLRIDGTLTGCTPRNDRSQLKKTADNALVIDAYNANPTSMMTALQNFRNMTAERKMLILGDMRELGTENAAEHRKIVEYLQECSFKRVLLVGESFASTNPPCPIHANTQELIEDLQTKNPQDCTILIKGSNDIKLSTVVKFL